MLTPQRSPSPTACLISARGVADHDADVGDARVDHVFDGIEEHRLVGDRHQLLGAGVSDRAQARALAAAEY